MTPDGADNRIQLLPLESPERDAEILSVDDEAQRPLVHVEYDEELVRNDERFVRFEQRRVRDARVVFTIVIELVPAQVPAPRRVRAADEALIPDGVQRRLGRRHPDHRVSPALPRRPANFPRVQPLREADLSAYAVRRLRHRVPVEGEFVVVLDEYVQ